MTFSVSSNYLDISVGMLLFSRPELRLSKKVKFLKGSDSFRVYEVGLDGTQARPLERVEEEFTCSESGILKYVMCKEDMPTPDAARVVSKTLSVDVSYAGIKDSEGFTCQFITIKCRSNKRLKKFYEFSDGKLTLYFHSFTNSMLRRGFLEGNYFEIILEDLSEADLEVLRELRNTYDKTAFLNYYGYQRFGVRRPITHLVGKALLEGNFEEAVDLIIGTPYPTESQRVIEARKSYDEGNLREALRLFPRKFSIERSLIKGLLRGLSAREVLKLISEWLARMYVEAYQSYLFNLALSKLTIQLGSIDALTRKCDVIPLPRPHVSLSDECTRESIKAVEEELKSINTESEFFKYLSKSSREVVFTLQNFTYEVINDKTLLKFFLRPSTYATVFLRELIDPSSASF